MTSTVAHRGRAHRAPTHPTPNHPTPNHPTPNHPTRKHRRGLALFAALNALAAWGGAVGLAGGGLSFGAELDRRLPLHSSLLAGGALALLVAVPLSALAWCAWRDDPRTDRMAVGTGLVLIGWIAVQLLFLRAFSFFQPFYLAVGIGLVVLGRGHRRARAPRRGLRSGR